MHSIRRVILLDIDGTLNDNSWKENNHVPWILHDQAALLDYIISETGAQLILTSQRRQAIHSGRISLSGFQMLLKSHGIKGNLAGYIPYTDNWEDKRFLIKDWLRTNSWKYYVVLDDVDMHCDNQVFIDPQYGLTQENADEAIQLLTGELHKKRTKDESIEPDESIGIELEQ